MKSYNHKNEQVYVAGNGAAYKSIKYSSDNRALYSIADSKHYDVNASINRFLDNLRKLAEENYRST